MRTFLAIFLLSAFPIFSMDTEMTIQDAACMLKKENWSEFTIEKTQQAFEAIDFLEVYK